MFTEGEQTQERIDAYRGGLEHERQGYERRIAGLNAGGQDPLRATVTQLEARLRDVDAELARVKKLRPVVLPKEPKPERLIEV